jgi:acylphosphatase
MECRRCTVSGQVQGVFYRASAQRKARELGLTGYARNLPDGRVEVLMCGEPLLVAALCAWLGQGPPRARVAAVEWEKVEIAAPGEFTVK